MSTSLSDAIKTLKASSIPDAFEIVYNSIVPDATDDGNRERQQQMDLCGSCCRGWKCLIYDTWVRDAVSKGWDPRDLDRWGDLRVMYARLKHEHRNVCSRASADGH